MIFEKPTYDQRRDLNHECGTVVWAIGAPGTPGPAENFHCLLVRLEIIKNTVDYRFVPALPIAKTQHHHVRFKENWTMCAIIVAPKSKQNAIPAPFDGI